MKVFCPDCGCHFNEDFEKTLKCSFWKSRNLDKLPKKYKKILWKWVFSSPQDELVKGAGCVLHFDWRATSEKYTGNEFVKYVPGYKDWPDKRCRQFQREYFKFIQSLDNKDRVQIWFKTFLATHKK